MTDEKLLELCRDMTAEVRDEDYYACCPICEGIGIVNDQTGTAVQCPDCDGEGWTEI
jgi:transcription initiation factor IIE alpha subunit